MTNLCICTILVSETQESPGRRYLQNIFIKVHYLLIECTESRQTKSTKVTILDIANELQLSRNTVTKAINNTGVLADATREKILRKAAEMGYKQFSYLPVFDGNSNAGDASILPVDKREIAILTTRFLNNSHFAAMMLDRFQ